MNSKQFKQARRELGLTMAGLARILDVNPRTVRKWEAPDTASTARAPNPIACQVLRWLKAGDLVIDP